MFKGDNFVKFSGDAPKVLQHAAFEIQANNALKNDPAAPATAQQQRHNNFNEPPQAAAPTGSEVNAVAMPSQTAMLFKQHAEKRQNMQSANL